MKWLVRDHIPAPEGDQNDRNETADDPADGFGALSFEFIAQAGANLAADQPAQRAAKEKADNCEDRRADEEADIFSGDGGSNADREETADSADDGAGECSYIGFTETGFTHGAKISQNDVKSNDG